MKKLLVLLSAVLISSTLSAQVLTYTTKIGNLKGPVKSMLMTNDQNTSMMLFNHNGTLERNINSTTEYYIVLEWGADTITQKFYNNNDDSLMGQSVLAYEATDSTFLVANDAGAYYWDHSQSSLTALDLKKKKNNILWVMVSENISDEGYTSSVYVNDQRVSANQVKTLDKDEYGNATRIITITPDGVEHESTCSYEYYDKTYEEAEKERLLQLQIDGINAFYDSRR